MSEDHPEPSGDKTSGLDPLVQHLRENHRLTLLGSLAGKIVHGMNNTLTSLKANIPYLESALQTAGAAEEATEALSEIRYASRVLEATVEAFDGTSLKTCGSVKGGNPEGTNPMVCTP